MCITANPGPIIAWRQMKMSNCMMTNGDNCDTILFQSPSKSPKKKKKPKAANEPRHGINSGLSCEQNVNSIYFIKNIFSSSISQTKQHLMNYIVYRIKLQPTNGLEMGFKITPN